MEEVERIQYHAALAITGAWKGSSRIKLYEELGWESLSDRRLSRRILQVHKIENNNTPSYLKEKLPLHNRPPKNSFLEYRCRTERFRKSFFPDAIGSWNIFIDQFPNMPSFNVLKLRLKSFFRPIKKSIFNIHDPPGIRYLFQLRLGLSPLRRHKKHHNFADTPSDLCRCNIGVEDTKHFLFKCPLFAAQRATLAVKVIGILIRNNLNHLGNVESIYMYGNDSMDETDNRNVLLATIKFIKDSKRFS